MYVHAMQHDLQQRLTELEPGDKIRATRVFEVEKHFRSGGVVVKDIVSGARFTLSRDDTLDVHAPLPPMAQGSLTVEVVDRAKREYKVGDELTGTEVDEWDAPGGATVVSVNNPRAVYTVDWDLEWTRTAPFRSSTVKYRIVYLP